MVERPLHYAGLIYSVHVPGTSDMETLQHKLDKMHTDLKFTDGFATVKPSGSALKAFDEAIYPNSVESDLRAIRYLCRYEAHGNELYSYLGEDAGREIQKQILIEKTLRIVMDSYGDAERQNGEKILKHVLEAALTVAAVYALHKPGDRIALVEIVLTILHDIIEDVEDGSEGMKGVKFRARRDTGEKVELAEKEDIYAFITEMYGRHYGPEIVKLLKFLSRPPKVQGEILSLDQKIERYNQYLIGLLPGGPRALIPKSGDGNSNKKSVLNITDEQIRIKKKESVIYKITPQILYGGHMFAVIKEILLYGYREVAEGTVFDFDQALRAPDKEDVENLARGHKIVGPRSNSRSLIDSLLKSGLPGMIYFEGGKVPEISFQFCDSFEDAKRMVREAIGEADVRRSRKFVPTRVDYETLVSVHAPEAIDPKRMMERLQPAYDDYLRSHPHLEIFRSFNRRHKAQAAREMCNSISQKDRAAINRFNICRRMA
ncbi:MAG: hypothetical protein WC717_01270 [Candidatus Micrarchaeia archaeon]|jgi:hypothetical protein